VSLEPAGRAHSLLASATLAAILLAGALWALNYTDFGRGLKCRYLNDVWACLTIAVDSVVPDVQAPRPRLATTTPESPEERAQRERQQRIEIAVARVRSTISDLRTATAEVESSADSAADAAASVDAALAGIDSAQAALASETRKRPMSAFQQDEVCFALDEVLFAKDDHDFALDDYDLERESYLGAVADHRMYVSALERAKDELNSAVGTDSTWARLAADAESTLTDAAAQLAAVEAVVAEAAALVGEAVRAADAKLAKSRELASTIAPC
jgi:hypothetical protein